MSSHTTQSARTCMLTSLSTQVVAYNKMDVPDASDYWPDMRELLINEEGIQPEDCLAISAVAGHGTTELVRRVRARLDELPAQVIVLAARTANVIGAGVLICGGCLVLSVAAGHGTMELVRCSGPRLDKQLAQID